MFRRRAPHMMEASTGPSNVRTDQSPLVASPVSATTSTTMPATLPVPAPMPLASTMPVPAATTGSSALAQTVSAVDRYANGTVVLNGRYRLERTIGKGSYGKVKLAADLKTGERVAIKFISKSSIKKPAHSVRINREIALLSVLDHPNVVRLIATQETSKDIVLVMEWIRGEDLFNHITRKACQYLTEREARPIFRQIVAALDYCHANRVIHRDMKPENVMLDEQGRVRLIDFGFATLYHPRGHLETNCGSPLYAAPEIVQGSPYVGPEVDVWSLGVVLYAMLTGSLPFEHEQLKGLYSKICAGHFSIPSFLSPAARSLIQLMLTVDVQLRATLAQIKQHPWLAASQVDDFALDAMPSSEMEVSSRTLSTEHIYLHPRDELIERMTRFGFNDLQRVRFEIINDPDSPASYMYRLLVEREREHQLLSYEQEETVDPENGLITPPMSPHKQQPLSSLPRRTRQLTPSSLGGDAQPPLCGWVNVPQAPRIIQTVPLAATAVFSSQTTDSNHPLINGTVPASTPSNHLNVPVNVPSLASTSIRAGSIVSQAAAHVASRFRKLRDLRLIGLGGGSAATSAMAAAPIETASTTTSGINAVPSSPELDIVIQSSVGAAPPTTGSFLHPPLRQ